MKNLSVIILNTLIFFVLINILIALFWPYISDKRNTKHSYNEKVSNFLELSEKDLIVLQNETWRKDYKFRYEPFIGHTEINKSGKFVNFTFENGRKVDRPKNCTKNLYMYGGSTTFGYGVTDYQTISAYLQNSLTDYCVFNHGRASYYSLQENNLFYSHLETNKKIDYAIFLDGINEVCGEHFAANSLRNNFSSFLEKPYLLWKKSSINFLYSLPIYQLSLKFGSKDWLKNSFSKSYLSIESCNKEITLDVLFQKRLDLRESLCKKFKVDCYTFLQPFPGVTGLHLKELISPDQLNYHLEKYNLLKSIENKVIDLQYVLRDDNKISFIDAVHYSPQTNKKIAKEIKSLIFKNE